MIAPEQGSAGDAYRQNSNSDDDSQWCGHDSEDGIRSCPWWNNPWWNNPHDGCRADHSGCPPNFPIGLIGRGCSMPRRITRLNDYCRCPGCSIRQDRQLRHACQSLPRLRRLPENSSLFVVRQKNSRPSRWDHGGRTTTAVVGEGSSISLAIGLRRQAEADGFGKPVSGRQLLSPVELF